MSLSLKISLRHWKHTKKPSWTKGSNHEYINKQQELISSQQISGSDIKF